MADTDGRYAFPHDGADERRRLDMLAARLDPLTKRRIGSLGLAPDVCCLEVGGGRGSAVRLVRLDTTTGKITSLAAHAYGMDRFVGEAVLAW